jgi:hypothetical protein
LTIELTPVPGNKPGTGAYTCEVSGKPVTIEYERVGNHYKWSAIVGNSDKPNVFETKDQVLEFLDGLDKLTATDNNVHMWQDKTQTGLPITIRLTLETLDGGSLYGEIATNLKNNDNNQAATNWLIDTVIAYCKEHDIKRPNRIAVKWGAIEI